MKTVLRVIILVAVLLATIGLAQSQSAWAQPAAQSDQSVQAQAAPDSLKGNDDHGEEHGGTVQPPPRLIRTCSSGDYALGGIAGLRITDLKPGYCVQAFLWNHRFGFGHIPGDAGQFLADITLVAIFHDSRLIRDLPIEDGKILICYAVPPGKQAQIYSFSFRKSEPSWTPLETTIVQPGVVCAPAQSTGAYALIGK